MVNTKDLLILLRPAQWLKNVFVFMPLFFGGKMLDWQNIEPTIVVFIAYCFAASGIYCFNDIFDVGYDRKHPLKSSRSVARGAVSLKVAYVLMTICYLLSQVSFSSTDGVLVVKKRLL